LLFCSAGIRSLDAAASTTGAFSGKAEIADCKFPTNGFGRHRFEAAVISGGSIDAAKPLRERPFVPISGRRAISRQPITEERPVLIENKYAVMAAVVGFLLTLWLTDGSMIIAFGVLALIAGAAWAVRRLRG
jgi:hypothetical protein